MTAADLIKACRAYEDEHGIGDLLELMNDIIIASVQRAGLTVEYEIDDDIEEVVDCAAVYTIQ